MIDRATRLLPTGLFLLPLLAAAQGAKAPSAPSVPGVPSRPLLGEMEKAAVGSAATIHTEAGSGPGMVLAASQEILASLHLVLTSKGQVAPHIAVDISTPPQKPITNLVATVEAQDPGDGLVLLKLARPIPAQPVPVTAAEAPAATPLPVVHVRKREIAEVPQQAPVAESEVAQPVAPSADSEQSFYVNDETAKASHRPATSRRPAHKHRKPNSQTRVVYDGPLPQ